MGLMAGGTRSRTVRALVDYAELVRVPNLFTAPPDVLLGAALAAGAGASVSPFALVGLAVASVLLYGAGTTLNDAFDAPEDAIERPRRPIPSGRVARHRGFVLGAGLLLGGVATAGVVAGTPGGVVGAVLAGGILLYDGALKGGTAGFAAMGTVRGLNVLLGVTATRLSTVELPAASIGVVVAVAVYVAAFTLMAATETESGDRSAVVVAGVGALAVGLLAVSRPFVVRSDTLATVVTIALTFAFLWWVGGGLVGAYRDPVPGTIGPAVGTCVLGLVVLDAALAAPAGLGWSVAILSFLVPAVGLQRSFSVS